MKIAASEAVTFCRKVDASLKRKTAWAKAYPTELTGKFNCDRYNMRQRERLSSKQIFTTLMIGAVICLLIPVTITNKVDRLLSEILGPFSRKGASLSVPIAEKLRQDGPASVSSEKYNQLKDVYLRDRNRLVNLAEEVRYLKNLTEKLTGVRLKLGTERAELIPAYITGSESSMAREVRRLVYGQCDRVREGQIVLGWVGGTKDTNGGRGVGGGIAETGVVGKIIGSTGSRTASLQLLCDPEFRAPALVVPHSSRKEKWRADGMLRGEGLGQVSITMIPYKNFPVRPGDVVLAGAGAKHLPVEMIVGTVQSCRRDKDNPVLWHISVRPAVEPQRLQEVIIIGY